MAWTLVLHENALVQSTAVDLLAEALPWPVYGASNVEQARKLLDGHGRNECRLVVSSLSPPLDKDASQPLDRSRPTALVLLESMRSGADRHPWLFLVSYDDGTRSAELPGLPNVQSINVLHMVKALRTQAGILVGLEKQPPPQVVVDIDLVDGVYRWSLRGLGAFPLEKSGLIDVTSKDIIKLRSASLQAYGSGCAAIGKIGRDIYRHFLADNLKSGLELALSRAIGDAIEEARFRFCVDNETNEMLFEALGKPRSQSKTAKLDHWMLRSPIFRAYRGGGERRPLFKDEQSRIKDVSCLIIQGGSASFNARYVTSNDEYIPARCDSIGLAAREAETVHAYFSENFKQFGLSMPTILTPGKHPGSYADLVRKTLASQRWQMIHYAGHSGISERGTAYLALGEGKRDVLDIDEFSRLASGAQFVYLSSCQSSNTKFVMKLVEQNIPAVLGYAWPVADDDGIDFAQAFYKHLFGRGRTKRFLEYAFMRTKRDMHNKAPKQVGWASPLLFMQMLASEGARIH